MDTNKDFLLRIIKQIILLLEKLINDSSVNEEKINSIIDNFIIENLKEDDSFFSKKNSNQIIDSISKIEQNLDFIKDIADILYIKVSIEKNYLTKKELAKKNIELFNFYEQKASVFSFDIKSKLSNLETILNND